MKSRSDIAEQVYLGKHDIQELLQVSRSMADKLYNAAMKVDRDELKDRVIHDSKARLQTVLKVAGINYSLLIKQIKGVQ